MKFALKHIDKPLSFWEKVLWSDESKIDVHANRRTRCWRPALSSLRPAYLNWSRTGSASSVMLWGCMSAAGTGSLHHVAHNIDAYRYIDILEARLEESRRKLRLPREWICMQDSASIHNALMTFVWLLEEGYEWLDWPANSPDLNPIENLWAYLKKRIWGSGRANKKVLFERALKAWQAISPSFCRHLVHSMRRRLKAVIDARGGPTKY